MARPAVRIQVVEFGVLVGLALLVGRAAQVQILHGRRWAEEAQAQRTERIVLQARRGALYDRHGTPLAVTQETYHVGIAPNELRDAAADGTLISRRLGLTVRTWQQALRRRYAYFAGPYSALEVQPLRSVRGVHLESVLNRFYPDPAVARATIGRLGDEGLGASGLERTLDSLLAGRSGAAVVLKDRAGREYESPARVIAPPVPGLDVVLTLDAELQEIAQRALDDALRRMDADGGDVVMLDPGTGEVLALASRQRDGSARPSAFTDTFEPGSLAKIFAAAALLSLRRVSPTDHVSGEGGKWRVLGRTITDEDPQPSLTLADAIRVSSNIAIAKFAARLTPLEQYATLRDFGFGAFTGIEFPAEATGRLRPPSEWTRPSAASLAMGYELSVTPIQVAMAYGALANDGLLLQPTLIREIRGAGGGVRYRHRPEPVRRVVSRDVAVALRNLLRGVVERGTGIEAALTNFPVAAKTGTARRVVNGRYAAGEYTASFAALFPADQPQLVLVVKIDNPHKGSYFAAQTAAPVTRSMLEQALAARTVALDRARLSTAAPRAAAAPADDEGGLVPYVVPWPYQPDSAGVGPRRAVPDVAGLGMREAVRTLHRRGFRVALRGWGVAEHTWPAAGDSAAAGSMVTLFADPHAAGRGDEQAAGSGRRARARAAPRRNARPAHLARHHRPHGGQPEGGARHAVLRRARVGARRARVRDGRARARGRGRAGRARAAGGYAADPGARRAARRCRRGGSVVRPSRDEARPGRRHGDERQDDFGHAAAARPVRARADGLDRHAGRVRCGGRPCAERGRQPHHARADRPPGDARRARRAWRARRGHGGLLAQPRSGPRGWTRVPRGRLHQPDARPPRLP